jgi:hypothetical protein
MKSTLSHHGEMIQLEATECGTAGPGAAAWGTVPLRWRAFLDDMANSLALPGLDHPRAQIDDTDGPPQKGDLFAQRFHLGASTPRC